MRFRREFRDFVDLFVRRHPDADCVNRVMPMVVAVLLVGSTDDAVESPASPQHPGQIARGGDDTLFPPGVDPPAVECSQKVSCERGVVAGVVELSCDEILGDFFSGEAFELGFRLVGLEPADASQNLFQFRPREALRWQAIFLAIAIELMIAQRFVGE